MKKWFNDWTPLPADMLIQVLLPVIFIVIAVLTSILLPLLQRLRRTDAWSVFGVAIAAGVLGMVLLIFARLPLYRRREFLAVGPRLLDIPHRRLYWLAYCFVAASVLVLLSMLAVLR